MYLLENGTRRYSPSDLISYLDGDFAAWCERLAAERNFGKLNASSVPEFLKRDEKDDELTLAATKGDEHEARYLAALRQREPGLVELTRDSRPGETLDAMRAGAPAISQACLEHSGWRGFPDFLFRVPGKSALGDYHYEPWDTKLARSPKPYFLIQLCAYADLLEQVQGARPRRLVIVLGNGVERAFPTDDFFFHFLECRDAFLAFQNGWDPSQMPHPGFDRGYGNWSDAAEAYLEKCDHLSRVANITRRQISRLEAAGINTLTALAKMNGDEVDGIAPDVRRRLVAQARLQHGSRGTDVPRWEPQAPVTGEPRRGLALLPPPSKLDVFFDMEGFPFAEGGLEYLFGATVNDVTSKEFHDWWAHESIQEKRAFEQFMDYVTDRRLRDPSMHVYHYAAYERSALCRLMGKYATRERELDDLLRSDVFVDLYTVVRQALIVGTPSYSLKDIERLYLPKRDGAVTTAGGSVVEYQRWLDSGEPEDCEGSDILCAIRDYNKIDCESTSDLRDWLIARQLETGIGYVAQSGADESAQTAAEDERGESPALLLASRLHAAAAKETDPERRRVTELVAWLLEFHRREEKPMWWRYFDRMDMNEEELRSDPDCLAGVTRTSTPPIPVKQSFAYEYEFDPDQDTKLGAESSCIIVGLEPQQIAIYAFDAGAGLLQLKIKKGRSLPERVSLIPDELVSAESMKQALLRFGAAWLDGTPSSSLSDLLLRRPPNIRGHSAGSLIDDAQSLLPQAVDVVKRMEGTTLCVQGPPGTGKTYTAAAMIVDLLAQGKRVGVTANSHKVIMNLMAAVAKARAGAAAVPTYKVGDSADDAELASASATQIESKQVAASLGDGAALVGGTAWVFSRPELAGRFDYLFVDEAGQVSLANAVAVGMAATNLVLIGDQMQLGQPTQGTHPGESGSSCLDYALHGRATIPEDLGIFLGTSWRMHPDICRFISGAFYEGRLGSRPDTGAQRVAGSTPGGRVTAETGIVFVPVKHEACTQSSAQEAGEIEGIVAELLQRTVIDKHGVSHPLTLDDILFVAPFNMQVRQLRERLGDRARVGSVDKFQGQEAPVVIVSLCASTLEEAPRGASFLLERNRLNVAVSRAQALDIVVASPSLLEARCGSIEEMRLVNGLCRLARHQSVTA